MSGIIKYRVDSFFGGRRSRGGGSPKYSFGVGIIFMSNTDRTQIGSNSIKSVDTTTSYLCIP